jgi:hypothetical protein
MLSLHYGWDRNDAEEIVQSFEPALKKPKIIGTGARKLPSYRKSVKGGFLQQW